MNFIAVVLNAPSSKERMADIKTLFEWGFANCQVYTDENLDSLPKAPRFQRPTFSAVSEI